MIWGLWLATTIGMVALTIWLAKKRKLSEDWRVPVSTTVAYALCYPLVNGFNPNQGELAQYLNFLWMMGFVLILSSLFYRLVLKPIGKKDIEEKQEN